MFSKKAHQFRSFEKETPRQKEMCKWFIRGKQDWGEGKKKDWVGIASD